METSLYSVLRNRVIQDALPQELRLASYIDMYRDAHDASTEMEEYNEFIECGLTSCRVGDDSEPVPEDIERCN